MSAAAKAAAAIAVSGEEKIIRLIDSTCANISPAARIGSTIPLEDKIVLARRAYRAAREYSSEVSQSTVRLLDYDRNILIATSDRLKVSDRQVRSRILINANVPASIRKPAANRKGMSASSKSAIHIDTVRLHIEIFDCFFQKY